MLRKLLVRSGILLGLVILLLGAYVGTVSAKYSSSMAKVYEIPLPAIEHSTDSAVIERGRHLAASVAGCAGGDCHGSDLSGGITMDAGPVGRVTGPNITPRGVAGTYSDGELARLILHGVRKDGTSVRFMPSAELSWLPDEDVTAIISYVRSVPGVEKPNGPVEIGLLGRVLDRNDMMVLDVARRIDHENRPKVPTPAPTAAYGEFLARSCVGCHGEHLSGGKIPGTPASMAIPLNLTPDETGLKGWTFEDFVQVMASAKRKDGRALDPMMPVTAVDNLNETEKRALFAYLQTLPPTPFGQR